MKGLLCIPDMAVAACRNMNPKTNTRRVIADAPADTMFIREYRGVWQAKRMSHDIPGLTLHLGDLRCEYKVGERRCLLTTWAVSSLFDDVKPSALDLDKVRITGFWHAGLPFPKMKQCGKLRPGRFLPNHLRLLIPVFEIVSVRAERVQDISEEDAKAEGVVLAIAHSVTWSGGKDVHREGFPALWDSINADRKDKDGKRLPYAWADNPWVWRVEFVRFNEVGK